MEALGAATAIRICMEPDTIEPPRSGIATAVADVDTVLHSLVGTTDGSTIQPPAMVSRWARTSMTSSLGLT